MRIEPVDPRDERAFDEWFAVVDEVLRAVRLGEVDHTRQEQRATALDGLPAPDGTPPAVERQDLLLARDDDGRAVGAARLERPLTDNTAVGFVLLHVAPPDRRRGVGTALLADVAARCQDDGRSVLMTELDEAPADLGRSPGRAFLEQAGFAEVLVEVRRDLALPVDPARLDAVEAAARVHADGYVLRTWSARCPDDLVDDRAELARRMSLDVPLGDLSWQEEAWDADRVRRREQLVAQQGRSVLGAGAVHEASGALVAFTEVAGSEHLPERVHQWETFVLDSHRGHRLGTLVKTAVLRRIAVELPQARTMLTANATTNAPMIAVNEALGFRPNGAVTAWERKV